MTRIKTDNVLLRKTTESDSVDSACNYFNSTLTRH